MITNGQMSGNTRLTGYNGIFTDGNAARNSDQGDQNRIRSHGNIVCDVNQVICFYPLSDVGLAEGAPIDGIIGPDFNIVINLHVL